MLNVIRKRSFRFYEYDEFSVSFQVFVIRSPESLTEVNYWKDGLFGLNHVQFVYMYLNFSELFMYCNNYVQLYTIILFLPSSVCKPKISCASRDLQATFTPWYLWHICNFCLFIKMRQKKFLFIKIKHCGLLN